jgi:phage repressor protein C with HTH and peptisase S24 domain
MIGNNIKTLRLEAGLSQDELALQVGISQPSLNKIEKNETKNPRKLSAIAKFFSVTEEFLRFNNPSSLERKNNRIFNFDLLDVQASAGTGVALLDESVVQSISIDEDKFQELFKCAPTDSMKIINIKGDSMTPTFKDNDFILVDIANTVLADGVFVFRVNDELYVKRLQRLPNKVVALSDNSNYIPFDLPENTEIVARVVCAWQFNQL